MRHTLILALMFVNHMPAFAEGDSIFKGKALTQLLEESAKVTCDAQSAATTGYYQELTEGGTNVVLKSYPLKRQSAAGAFKITINSDSADVRDLFLNSSSRFRVQERRADGIILIRTKGVGVEVITIDPRNGSFLLTDTGVQVPWNRATVWVGQCK